MDRDGLIDAFYDNWIRKRVPMVIFEGRLVEVKMWGLGRNRRWHFGQRLFADFIHRALTLRPDAGLS